MLKIGRFQLVGAVHLRMALAVVFFLVSSFQGTLFASAGSTDLVSPPAAAHQAMAVDHASHAHQHDRMADAAMPDQGHHGSQFTSDGSCEVHCAPVTAVPVSPVEMAHAVARCFAPSIAAVLIDGNYAEFIRPPRQLI